MPRRGKGLLPLSPHPFLRKRHCSSATLRIVFLDEAERFRHNRNASVATLRKSFAFGPECRSRSLRNQRSPSPESAWRLGRVRNPGILPHHFGADGLVNFSSICRCQRPTSLYLRGNSRGGTAESEPFGLLSARRIRYCALPGGKHYRSRIAGDRAPVCLHDLDNHGY